LHKILAPVAFLAYFALMLPHKTLLQVWLLEHLSILFMPLLFLCFGALLDLWIFVALYAWLASTTPALAHTGPSAGLGGAASLHPSNHPDLIR
jgi:Kef-type K+ transport system membrane component KefB